MTVSANIIEQLVPRVPRQLRDGGYDPTELDRWMQAVNRLLGAPASPAAFNITTTLVGLDTKAEKTTTVNGHPLSANVVVSASDLTTGKLPHAQLPVLIGADIPDNAANTTGNAATASHVPYSGLTGTVPTWNQDTTGTAAGLSADIAESRVTGLVADLAAKVPATLKVNGQALGADVTVTAVDGSAGLSVVVVTAALTLTGAQGSMTFKDGLLTAQVQAT